MNALEAIAVELIKDAALATLSSDPAEAERQAMIKAARSIVIEQARRDLGANEPTTSVEGRR